MAGTLLKKRDSHRVQDVRLLDDANLRILGNDYNMVEGEVYTVPAPYARKMVNIWGVAEYDSEARAVAIDEYENAVGQAHAGRKAEPEPEGPAEDEDEGVNPMVDNYLEQNARTVVASLEEDDLGEEILEQMLEYEREHGERVTVIRALEERLDE